MEALSELQPRHIFVISCRSLGMKQGSEEDEGIGYLAGNKYMWKKMRNTDECTKNFHYNFFRRIYEAETSKLTNQQYGCFQK